MKHGALLAACMPPLRGPVPGRSGTALPKPSSAGQGPVFSSELAPVREEECPPWRCHQEWLALSTSNISQS
eukprot:CAMPEP_0183511156 /NCGR_PEP_ID=MMETSP0371-20130417/10727_1 /TAXON_ID=268820 /ORGANISM="Peridinium aciculiferum, Strain PAER-2" /LENGTH=70 /DNA_ID=CAMNT_0025708047 /DNA_START=138 /DNA_END=347 /DNA_ORIENTATION=-